MCIPASGFFDNPSNMAHYNSPDDLIGAVLQLFRTEEDEDPEVVTIQEIPTEEEPPTALAHAEQPESRAQSAGLNNNGHEEADTPAFGPADTQYLDYYYCQNTDNGPGSDADNRMSHLTLQDLRRQAGQFEMTSHDYLYEPQPGTGNNNLIYLTEEENPGPVYRELTPEGYQTLDYSYDTFSMNGYSPPPNYATSITENHRVVPSSGAFKYEAAYMNQLEPNHGHLSQVMPISTPPLISHPSSPIYSYPNLPPTYVSPSYYTGTVPRPPTPIPPPFYNHGYGQHPIPAAPSHSAQLMLPPRGPALMPTPPGPPVFPYGYQMRPPLRTPMPPRPIFQPRNPVYSQAVSMPPPRPAFPPQNPAYSQPIYPPISAPGPQYFVIPCPAPPQMYTSPHPHAYGPPTTTTYYAQPQPMILSQPGPMYSALPPMGYTYAPPPFNYTYAAVGEAQGQVTPGHHYDYSQNNSHDVNRRRPRGQTNARKPAEQPRASTSGSTEAVPKSTGQKPESSEESSGTSSAEHSRNSARNWSSDTSSEDEVEYEEIEEEDEVELDASDGSAKGDDDEDEGPSQCPGNVAAGTWDSGEIDDKGKNKKTHTGGGDAQKSGSGRQVASTSHQPLSARSEKAICTSVSSYGPTADRILEEMQDFVYTFYLRGTEFPYISSVDPVQLGPPSNFAYYVPPRVDCNDFFGGQRRVFQDRMMDYFWPFFPNTWKLQALPDFKKPRESGWSQFTITSKLRFCCRSCMRPWTSMRGKIHFAFKLERLISEGFIFMKIFGQVCIQEKCNDRDFQTPAAYPEEIDRVLYKLSQYIAFSQYNMPLSSEFYFDPDRAVRVGNPKSPHRRELCQACHSGICSKAAEE